MDNLPDTDLHNICISTSGILCITSGVLEVTKKLREKVYRKYNGHCAYCGSELKGTLFKKGKAFQVDHIEPVHRQCIHADRRIKEAENIEMLHPACARCNRYKSNFSLEEFRTRVSKQVKQARKRSWNFRCAEDFGLITVTPGPVVFYFEKGHSDD